MANRWACCAILGKVAPKLTPGIEVFTAPVTLRRGSGASMFGSKVSIWLGPPHRNRKTTDLSRTNSTLSRARA